MNPNIIMIIIALFISSSVKALEPLPLWPDNNMPNTVLPLAEEEITHADTQFTVNVGLPTIEAVTPNKGASDTAVLILPGGGYHGVAYQSEGLDYAHWFAKRGVTAFVLKYRSAQASSVTDSNLAPIQDAQRAIRYIRHHAKTYGIAENKIGVIGSSAGGHLAAILTTHNDAYYSPIDEIDNHGFDTNFLMLIYPVISMRKGVTHQGSKNNLLGTSPSESQAQRFSADEQVSDSIVPTYIFHSSNDQVVDVNNSILMYQAVSQHRDDAEMHLYPDGGHGYGLGTRSRGAPNWGTTAEVWLKDLIQN